MFSSPLPIRSFSRRRASHLRLGRRGETLTCRVMRGDGFEILVRNYMTPKGEIDVVAREGETLCFVEVKTRRRVVRSMPGEAVGTDKRQRIARAAADYLRAVGFPRVPYRFDIAEVVLPRRGPIDIFYHRGTFVTEREWSF